MINDIGKLRRKYASTQPYFVIVVLTRTFDLRTAEISIIRFGAESTALALSSKRLAEATEKDRIL